MPVPVNPEAGNVAPMVVYLATDEAKDITGKFIYASGGDVCLYPRPFLIPGTQPVFLRKPGKWTVDELAEIIPTMLDI
jgi:3-oxoacyl-[acyl-carrier protein] reductase